MQMPPSLNDFPSFSFQPSTTPSTFDTLGSNAFGNKLSLHTGIKVLCVSFSLRPREGRFLFGLGWSVACLQLCSTGIGITPNVTSSPNIDSLWVLVAHIISARARAVPRVLRRLNLLESRLPLSLLLVRFRQHGESSLSVFQRTAALHSGDPVWLVVTRRNQKHECGTDRVP